METLRIFIAMLIFAAFSNLEAAVSGFEDIDALSKRDAGCIVGENIANGVRDSRSQ